MKTQSDERIVPEKVAPRRGLRFVTIVALGMTLFFTLELIWFRDRVAYVQALAPGAEIVACATEEECTREIDSFCFVTDANGERQFSLTDENGDRCRMTTRAIECSVMERDLGVFCQRALREVHGWPRGSGRFRIDPVGIVDYLPWLAGISAALVLITAADTERRRRRLTGADDQFPA